MKDFLKEIVDHKKDLVKRHAVFYRQIKERISSIDYTRYSIFKKMISKPDRVNLIAEIKKASPSQGLLREDFDVSHIARIYAGCKVDAMSVLTEDKFFLGKPSYLKKVVDQFNVPVLLKDFVISDGQIYEAKVLGASAVLLIVAILSDKQIIEFTRLAASLDLDCLVEVHSQDELKRALACKAEIIGINNRDLKTFRVDLSTSEKLLAQIPASIIKVAESGIQTHADVMRLAKVGVNAVLIGETFMRSADIGVKVNEVMGWK